MKIRTFEKMMRSFCYAAALLLPASVALRAQSPCGPGDAAELLIAKNSLASFLSGTTVSDSMYRVGTQLPKVASTAVTIVQDTTVCRQAASKVVQAWGSGSASDPIWVIKIGTTHFLAYNGMQHSANRMMGLVFDSTFTYLRSIVLF